MKDWHLHTTASDGFDGAVRILEKCVEIGLESISITDHDTVDAHYELEKHFSGHQYDISIITGVEIDCDFSGKNVEILGYGFELEDKELNAYLSDIQIQRRERARKYISAVNEHFKKEILSEKDVFLPGRSTILKPHVLRPLIDRGFFKSYKDAKQFVASVGEMPLNRISAQAAVEMIHRAGGKAYLAHPGVYDFEFDFLSDIVLSLKKSGLDGIEFYYPYSMIGDSRFPSALHARHFIEKLSPLCLGMGTSQGSDSHSVADLDRYWSQRELWAVL